METIYAKTLNPESFDYRYYDIREDEGNEVIIDGGRDFSDIDQKDWLKGVKKVISGYGSFDYDYHYNASIMEFLKDNLPKKANGKALSPREASIIQCALDNYNGDITDKEELISQLLSVIACKRYYHKRLCGYCQGDVVIAYYPSETSNEYLNFVEAWFWGTGTEVLIYEGDNEPETADDIEEGYTFYTGEWWRDADELKKLIRKEYGASEETPVKLWLFKGVKTIHIDQYEEATN